jgi:hypothetical protein
MKGFGSTTQSQRSVTSSNHRGVWEGARSRRTRPSFFCPYSPECVEDEFSEVHIQGTQYPGQPGEDSPPRYSVNLFEQDKSSTRDKKLLQPVQLLLELRPRVSLRKPSCSSRGWDIQ